MARVYKVAYYDETKEFKVAVTDDLEKYKEFTTRVYPEDYTPENGFGSEKLITSWEGTKRWTGTQKPSKFPKYPLHIVIFKSMSDEEVKLIIEKHCENFDPTVKNFSVSLAVLLCKNNATYTTNQYGISSARVTSSNPEIIIDCIDTGYLKPIHVPKGEMINPFK
jgi:hypothetical protein